MSSFTDILIVEKTNKGFWKTHREFGYYVGEEGSSDLITVPEGFLTDFASVPRPFWILFPPDGQYTQAAVLHDFLYSTQLRPRKEADNIFLEAMEVLGVPLIKRRIMWRAVRMFGWIPWNAKPKGVINVENDKNSA